MLITMMNKGNNNFFIDYHIMITTYDDDYHRGDNLDDDGIDDNDNGCIHPLCEHCYHHLLLHHPMCIFYALYVGGATFGMSHVN